MFVLNEEKILAVAQTLREKGEEKSDELLELLGGKELYQIFDELTVQSLVKSVIKFGRIHELCLKSNGFEILEGLLNRQIVGDMGKFYNVKPDYILGLVPEEQMHMAVALSEGNEELESLLLLFWGKQIATLACGGNSENAYFSFNLDFDDTEDLARIEEIVEESEATIDFSKFEDVITVSVYGEKENLYTDLLEGFQKEPSASKTVFLKGLLDATESDKEVSVARLKAGTFSNEEVDLLLQDNSRVYTDEIQGLTTRIAELGTSYENLNTRYLNLQDRFLRVRTFITEKIGRVPLLGRAVLGMLEKDLGQNALESGEKEKE